MELQVIYIYDFRRAILALILVIRKLFDVSVSRGFFFLKTNKMSSFLPLLESSILHLHILINFHFSRVLLRKGILMNHTQRSLKNLNAKQRQW